MPCSTLEMEMEVEEEEEEAQHSEDVAEYIGKYLDNGGINLHVDLDSDYEWDFI